MTRLVALILIATLFVSHDVSAQTGKLRIVGTIPLNNIIPTGKGKNEPTCPVIAPLNVTSTMFQARGTTRLLVFDADGFQIKARYKHPRISGTKTVKGAAKYQGTITLGDNNKGNFRWVATRIYNPKSKCKYVFEGPITYSWS